MISRIKSIDVFRGYVIIYMILLHTWMWGVPGGAITLSNDMFFRIISLIIRFISPEAEGFIFISGISFSISYYRKTESHNKIRRDNFKENYSQIRLKYLFQILFLFLLGFFYYNFRAYLSRGYLGNIWSWNIFQTLACSIGLSLMLINYNKALKIIIALSVLSIYGILYMFIPNNILTYPGDQIIIKGPLDLFYYIFFNGFFFTPILGFFPFFLIGSVVGEVMYEKLFIIDTKFEDNRFSKLSLVSLFIICMVLIITSGFISLADQFSRNSISWLIYSLGTNLLFFFILLTIEQGNYFHPKGNYKFFFYFSYYSLTIFIVHEILFPLLFQKFTISLGFFVSLLIIFLFFVGLRIIYNKFGPYFSLKVQISRLSSFLANRMIKKKELNH
ncbi:MAG: conserved membrane protein of unknown function [Promethearchaeota archaeon]|nr:MAG: conserved membrane protein of unknown function [Candidatus Lokiarchaeota archaeon]